MSAKLPHTSKKQSSNQRSFKSAFRYSTREKLSPRRQRSSSSDFSQPLLVVMVPNKVDCSGPRSPLFSLFNHGLRFRWCSFFNRSHFKLKLFIITLTGLVMLQYFWYEKSTFWSEISVQRNELPNNGTIANHYYQIWAWLGSGKAEAKQLKSAFNSQVVDMQTVVTTSTISATTISTSITVNLTTSTAAEKSVLKSSVQDDSDYNTTKGVKVYDDNVTLAAVNTDIAGDVKNEPVKFIGQNSSFPACPMVPPVLVGPIKVWFDYPSWPTLNQLYPTVEPGGHGKPTTCLSRNKVAIILPYRDRDEQLRAFLHNLHSLLTKQQLDYAIFVVEQVHNQTFNRAKLFNVGFVEAKKLYDWQCVIFHDVDLLPEDDRNFYTCPEQPRHMSVAVDKFKYVLPYSDIFGGISALTVEQFEKINGFSNDYWGWGGEDDDMASRVKLNSYKISRYPNEVARYKMIRHSQEKDNPVNGCRYSLMYKVKQRWHKDGLSSLIYDVKRVQLEPLFTRITVDLLEEESRKRLAAENICK